MERRDLALLDFNGQMNTINSRQACRKTFQCVADWVDYRHPQARGLEEEWARRLVSLELPIQGAAVVRLEGLL